MSGYIWTTWTCFQLEENILKQSLSDVLKKKKKTQLGNVCFSLIWPYSGAKASGGKAEHDGEAAMDLIKSEL